MESRLTRSSLSSAAAAYLQPAFLICTLVLVTAAAGMSMAIKSFGVYLKKEPLPIKKPLDLIDEKPLGSYAATRKDKITDTEMLEALGTENYLQWTIEDTDEPGDSSVRMCSLFITYYELPDRVPHVPEECYTGTGYQKLASEAVTIELAEGTADDGTPLSVPARYLVFTGMGSDHWRTVKFPILYLFNVNGIYANSREEARVALNRNIFGKHSYFSKVEWKFYGLKFGQLIYPMKDEAVRASGKLLSVLLPILEQEHWPDWNN
jgi:hypothetical protein